MTDSDEDSISVVAMQDRTGGLLGGFGLRSIASSATSSMFPSSSSPRSSDKYNASKDDTTVASSTDDASSTGGGAFLSKPWASTSASDIDSSSMHSSSSSSTTTRTRRNDDRKLGTLNGVFLPCLQTIIGVILFLRLTSITAQAGVVMTTLIIIVCVISTLLTALSLSAIATNGTIRAGGPYYVISRTLGVEIGGALGLLFYLGITIATSMYVLGAVEAIQSTASSIGFEHVFIYDTQLASLSLIFILACVVTVGVKYVNMTSNLFLGMVFLSIFCMCLGCIMFSRGEFMGGLNPWDRLAFDNIWPHYEPDPVTEITPTFFSLVALFYPSVTGILAGSNRSAVLANPGQSIPRGTIGAILCTTLIYIFVVWLFGLTISNVTLKDDKFVVATIAYPHDQVVKIGVITSCIGAALQCLAGSPRLLAAIAMDDSIPFLRFVKPEDAAAEPKRAIWATWLIASVPTLAGNLDHITPIVTMSYLLMYAGINASCFLLGFLKSPGFRPTFRYFHWSISLIGFVWCLGLALVIDWSMALATVVLFLMLYVYGKKQKSNKDWGDVGDSIRYNVVTNTLRQLTGTTTEHFHAKNWRPQLLTFVDTDDCGNPTNLHVLSLASQLKLGRGINMVVSIMQRDRIIPQSSNDSKVKASDATMLGMDFTGGESATTDPIQTTASSSTRSKSDNGCFDQFEIVELVRHSKVLLQRHMQRENMDGFAEVAATSHNISEAVWSAVIHTGLGPLSPNTVMLSLPRDWSAMGEEHAADYISTIRGIMNMGKALLLFRGNDTYPSSTDVVPNGCIDVWWVVHDGGLLLLLPYVLSKNHVWGRYGAKLRLFAVITSTTEDPHRIHEAVTDHLSRVRINASVTVVDLSMTTIADDMREERGDVEGMEGLEGCMGSCGISRMDSMAGGNMSNTHDRTIGEAFSDYDCEVPYNTVLGDEEMNLRSAMHGESIQALTARSIMDHVIKGEQGLSSSTVIDGDQAKRLKTAAAFNRLLQQHSWRSNLVVTNMPLIRADKPTGDFFDYVDTMCDGINNLLLVRGSGNEVITTYA